MLSPLFHTTSGTQATFLQGMIAQTSSAPAVEQAPSIYEIARAYGVGEYPTWKSTSLGTGFPTVSFSTNVVHLHNRQIVTSVAQAEQDIFDLVPDVLTETVDMNAPFAGTLHNPLAIYINRAGNRIAARTRRGAGNVALMHWATWDMLYHSSMTPGIHMGLEEQCGRWTHKGFVNSSMKLYVGYDIPVNEVFVAYVGANRGLTDGPLAVVENRGYYYAVHAPINVNILSRPSDYVYRLRYEVA